MSSFIYLFFIKGLIEFIPGMYVYDVSSLSMIARCLFWLLSVTGCYLWTT